MAIIPTSGEFTKVPEGGGGGGVFVVTEVDDTLDKTWNEISSAMANGNIVIILGTTPDRSQSYSFVTSCSAVQGTYMVTATTTHYARRDQAITSTTFVYTATSATGTLSIDKAGTINYTM